MIDINTFSREVVEELRSRFPNSDLTDGEFQTQLVSMVALVATLAIEKYDREKVQTPNC